MKNYNDKLFIVNDFAIINKLIIPNILFDNNSNENFYSAYNFVLFEFNKFSLKSIKENDIIFELNKILKDTFSDNKFNESVFLEIFPSLTNINQLFNFLDEIGYKDKYDKLTILSN